MVQITILVIVINLKCNSDSPSDLFLDNNLFILIKALDKS